MVQRLSVLRRCPTRTGRIEWKEGRQGQMGQSIFWPSNPKGKNPFALSSHTLCPYSVLYNVQIEKGDWTFAAVIVQKQKSDEHSLISNTYLSVQWIDYIFAPTDLAETALSNGRFLRYSRSHVTLPSNMGLANPIHAFLPSLL